VSNQLTKEKRDKKKRVEKNCLPKQASMFELFLSFGCCHLDVKISQNNSLCEFDA
jgi:hypothetical protein